MCIIHILIHRDIMRSTVPPSWMLLSSRDTRPHTTLLGLDLAHCITKTTIGQAGFLAIPFRGHSWEIRQTCEPYSPATTQSWRSTWILHLKRIGSRSWMKRSNAWRWRRRTTKAWSSGYQVSSNVSRTESLMNWLARQPPNERYLLTISV